MVDLAAGAEWRAKMRQAEELQQRDPERMAQRVLVVLDPDRGGADPRFMGRNYLLPNVAASAAERAAYIAKFDTAAASLFGPDALLAAAKIRGDGGPCRWCWSFCTARVGKRPTPHVRVGMRQAGERSRVRRAFENLLGSPCSACTERLSFAAKRSDTIRAAHRAQRRARSAPAASKPAAKPAAPALSLVNQTPAELRAIMTGLSIVVHATPSRAIAGRTPWR